MIKNNLATLKVNLITADYTGAILTYFKDDIVENKAFLQYIDEILISSKVIDHFSRFVIIQDEMNFSNDNSFLKNIMDLKLENQLLIFKNKKLIFKATLEEIKTQYFKNVNNKDL